MPVHRGTGPRPIPTATPLPTKFPDAIKEALRRSGLTRDAVSRHMARRGSHLSPATISAWTGGRQLPRSVSTVLAVEDTLGQQPGALLLRIPRPGGDAKTRAVFAAAGPERLNYIVTKVDERFQIGRTGLIEMIRVTMELRALFDLPEPAYFFTYDQTDGQRIVVEALDRCGSGTPRLLMADTYEMRIPLHGGPLPAGSRRPFGYAVHHSYHRDFRPQQYRYRRMTTWLLEEMAMTVGFPAAGRWIEFAKWPERDTMEFVESVGVLRDTSSERRVWRNPTDAAYGFYWQDPVR